MTPTPIRSILIANRSEIAIRVMRAASEMRIRTVAIYSQQDRQALHRFKADESYRVGEGKKPLAAYLDGDDILRIARAAKVDAIHPGYGFLSENPEFADAVIAAGMDGIAHKLDPGAPHNVNLYELTDAELKQEKISILPQNLHEALTALEKDKVVRDALGPVADEFLRLKHMEWVEYMRHVSEWEIESYLEFF